MHTIIRSKELNSSITPSLVLLMIFILLLYIEEAETITRIIIRGVTNMALYKDSRKYA